MRMSRFETRFVNAPLHSRRVAEAAERRLPVVPYRGRLKYLDVGCGNGTTALHLAAECGFEVTGIDVDPEQIRLALAAAEGREDLVDILDVGTDRVRRSAHFRRLSARSRYPTLRHRLAKLPIRQLVSIPIIATRRPRRTNPADQHGCLVRVAERAHAARR
jgi:SAM-dependent methyltransferase